MCAAETVFFFRICPFCCAKNVAAVVGDNTEYHDSAARHVVEGFDEPRPFVLQNVHCGTMVELCIHRVSSFDVVLCGILRALEVFGSVQLM